MLTDEATVCATTVFVARGVWLEISKGVVRRPLNWAQGRFRGGRPYGVESLGIAGPSDTLGSPWIPHEIRAYATTDFSLGNRNRGNFPETGPYLSLLILVSILRPCQGPLIYPQQAANPQLVSCRANL
jgi:hypothetical protein